MPSQFDQQPPDTDDFDHSDKREYGRDIAIDALLKACSQDLAKSRPERQVSQRTAPYSKPGKRPSVPALVSIAACIAVLLSFSWFVMTRSAPSQESTETKVIDSRSLLVQSITGDARLIGSNEALTAGTRIQIGEGVETGINSTITLAYPDGSRVGLESQSILVLQENNSTRGAKSLVLTKGLVNIVAKPQKTQFSIQTPFAKSKVLGTTFSLKVREDNTELIVREGKVRFEKPDSEKFYLVTDNQLAAIGPGVDVMESYNQGTPKVTSFSVISVTTGEVLQEIEAGKDKLHLSASEIPPGGINVLVNTQGHVSYVHIQGGGQNRKEKYPPWSVAGDRLHYGEGHRAWEIKPGTYRVRATPVTPEEERGPTTILRLELSE